VKTINIVSKRAVLGLGILAVSCALVACGSSSSGSTTTTTASSGTSASSSSGSFAARRAKLVACLKQHGVTLPNRPPGGGSGGGGGGGFFGGGGGAGGANPGGPNAGAGRSGGFFRNNPKAAAAFKACGADFGGGRFRPGAGGRFKISHTAINNFVACVRKHGYNLPKPNFSGKGSVFPSNIRNNAKAEAAIRACSSLLRPAGAPGASSGTSTTSSS
jgi:hypothetical protein